MEKGIVQGRREDLTGGGLIRSLGGWAEINKLKELGLSKRELARRLEMSPPAIGYWVERGKAIAHENEYRLIE